jgi:hypothetical protein
MCVLRDGCLLTNSDHPEAVKYGAITYRHLISDANIPRDLDSHTRKYMYVTANLRAKYAQYDAARFPQGARNCCKEWRSD